MKLTSLILGFCLLLAGCSTYSENGVMSRLDDELWGSIGISRAGYDETPLASDAYRIHAYGNQNASYEKTAAVALVRAAELAAEQGYDRFVIVDYDQWVSTSYYTTPTTATTDSSTRTNLYAHGSAYDVGQYTYADIYGRANSNTTSTTTVHHGQTYAIDKPKTDIVVMFVSNNAPEAARALRVADVIARYGKLAGYKPKEAASPVQMASIIPTQPTPVAPAQAAPAMVEDVEEQAETAPAAPPRPIAPIQVSADRAQPTLDEVYTSLSAGEKARVNRLPPAQRADYLEQMRERRF